MRILFLLTLLILGQSAIAYAQDKEALARVYYTNAEEFFNKKTTKDFENCVNELEKAEKALGLSNSKILYLKIKAMYEFEPSFGYYDYDSDNKSKPNFGDYNIVTLKALGVPNSQIYALRLASIESSNFVYYSYDSDTESEPNFGYYTYDLDNSLITFFKLTDANKYPIEKYSEIIKINDLFKEYKTNTKIDEKISSNYKTSFKGYFGKGNAYFYSLTPDYELATLNFIKAIRNDTIGVITEALINCLYNTLKNDTVGELTDALINNPVRSETNNTFKVFLAAAEMGNFRAMRLIGQMYHCGIIVDIDCNKAIYWYKKLAEKGNVVAMSLLGDLFSDNFGANCLLNYVEGADWYLKAIQMGDISSMYSLAELYAKAGDKEKSKEWKKKADLERLKFLEKGQNAGH